MNIGFIGAGKAGFTLGKYFRTHGIEVTGSNFAHGKHPVCLEKST